ncbi:hypothetical protein R6Q57_027530 [Mikania cordata]
MRFHTHDKKSITHPLALLLSSASSFTSQFLADSPIKSAQANRYGGGRNSLLVKLTGMLLRLMCKATVRCQRLKKIVENCGIGDAAQNNKGPDTAISDVALLTGQMPVKS